jgi:hypothetical protein
MENSPLRELAAQIEHLCREHPCWSQVHAHVFCLTDYLKARAYIEENRWREAEDSNRLRLKIDDSKITVVKKGEALDGNTGTNG